MFKVDYTDPNNFIYRYENVDISSVKNGDSFDIDKIYELYMRYYELTDIDYGLEITSFPVYPNLKRLDISNNQLKTFPVQPSLEWLNIFNNNLTYFLVQPEMKICYITCNKLKHFPTQPELEWLTISNDIFLKIDIQPKLKNLYIKNMV